MSTVPSPLGQGYSDTSLPIIDPIVPIIGNAGQIAPGGGKQVMTDAQAAQIAAHEAALSGKAPLASPPLTGVPTAPTAAPGTNSTQIATTAFMKAAIDALVNGAPGSLDALNELAAALGNDPNFAATNAAALGNRLRVDAPQGLAAEQKTNARDNIDAIAATSVSETLLNERAVMTSALPLGNLFDPARIVENAIVVKATGAIEAFGFGVAVIRFSVAPGKTYVGDWSHSGDSFRGGGVFLDVQGRKVGSGFTNLSATITAPAGAISAIMTLPPEVDRATAKLYVGASIPSDAPPLQTVEGVAAKVADAAVSASRADVVTGDQLIMRSAAVQAGTNQLVEADAVAGAVSTTTGAIGAVGGWYTSAFLRCTPGGKISANRAYQYAFYAADATASFISGGPTQTSGGEVVAAYEEITVPTGAKFYRVSTSTGLAWFASWATSVLTSLATNPFRMLRPLAGKRLSVIGNSQDNFFRWGPEFLRLTGMVLEKNYSVGGWRLSDMAAKCHPTNSDLSKTDLLIIGDPTNDYGSSHILGAITDTGYGDADGGAGTGTSFGAMKRILDNAYASGHANPGLKVMFNTAPYRGRFQYDGGGFTAESLIPPALNAPSYGGPKSIDDYNQAIRDFCAKWAIPCCDAARTSGFTAYNAEHVMVGHSGPGDMYIDKLHWNASVGGPRIGRLRAGTANSIG